MLFRMVLMSISLSIDALGIGISYELKGIKVGILSRTMMGIINAGVMGGAIFAGREMVLFFPPAVSEWIGTGILILVGSLFIKNALFAKEDCTCDFDHSKDINVMEAFLLGIALSADSLSIGIAAAVFHISILFMPLCVGFMQILFLWLGKLLVKNTNFKKGIDEKRSGIFAGSILIFMGIFRNL
ncbi:MAG: manganese efflux pump [Velocimicrobium sp.]